MNTCILLRTELVCAAANYADVPMASSVAWFDVRTMRHVEPRSLDRARPA